MKHSPGATGDATGTAIPGTAIGAQAAAVAAAGIGGAAAQRQGPGRDPARALGGAADAHGPAIKWSSGGKTRGWGDWEWLD